MDDLSASTTHFDRRALERETRDSRVLDSCLARGRARHEAVAPSRAGAGIEWAKLGLPVLDQPFEAEPEPEPFDHAWQEKWEAAVSIDVQAQARAAVFKLLARADRASLPLIRPLHQRAALHARLAARHAQTQISGFLHARLRAPALTTLARIQRAGRVLPRISAGPKISDS